MTTQLTTRNADLTQLVELLETQRVRRHDMVVHSDNLRARNGQLIVAGSEPVITMDGVDLADGIYTPTAVADEGVADKLGIPLAYVRRLRAENTPLWDANVNGWLERDERAFMLRTFRGDESEAGIARALLSNKYAVTDNYDALLATLDGVRQAGVAVNIDGCDLTERRMIVRISCPEVQALAPTLLKGYRSPFTGASGDENPVLWAGLRITNSETGGGAFAITPEFKVLVCNNGMTITRDALRAVHLGGRLEEGVIDWSEDTQRKNIELVQSKTADAVRTFLNVDYMEKVIARAEREAAKELPKHKDGIAGAVREVTKQAMFTEDQTKGILDHFIKGGQTNMGGVFNAITSFVQTVSDPDEAHAVQTQSARVLALA